MSTAVVLPAPVPPTMPTVLRAAIARFRPWSAGPLGLGIGVVHVLELEPLGQVQRRSILPGRRPDPRAGGHGHEVLVQLVERALGEAHLAERAIDLLQGGKQADGGEGVDREDRHHAAERSVPGDQQIEDEAEQRAEGDALDHIARHLAQDHVDGVIFGDALRRAPEAVGEVALEAEQLHVLHAAESLADDAEPLLVQLVAVLAHAVDALSHAGIEQGIDPADHPGGDERHFRPHHDEQGDQRHRRHQAGDELHRRQQGRRHDLLHLAEHGRPEAGAVPVEEPGIGLEQVAVQHPARDGVAAQHGEAVGGVGRHRLEDHAEDHEEEDAEGEGQHEALVAGEAEGRIGPRQIGVGLDDGRVLEHEHQRQDRGHRKHLDDAHHHDHRQQEVEASPLPRRQQVEELAIGVDHVGTLPDCGGMSLVLAGGRARGAATATGRAAPKARAWAARRLRTWRRPGRRPPGAADRTSRRHRRRSSRRRRWRSRHRRCRGRSRGRPWSSDSPAGSPPPRAKASAASRSARS